jgi:histidinol-phosphate aminotransferase
VSEVRVRLRPEIESMAPYRQGRQAAADAYKLSSNENPFDPIPAVAAAIADVEVNRYPDAMATLLREKLAARFGVVPDRIQVGAGSVSILDQLISAAAGPGDEVVYSWRSFEAYPGLVGVAGATSVQVPNTADHRHDLPAMAAAITDRTRVVIVCSPNNPTGAVVHLDEFVAFMQAVPASVLVLLDEAYAEFVRDPDAVDGVPLLDRYPNLVVLRTFSKAYGLAGLRVGYAIGAEYVMDAARATAIPLSVTGQAQNAAIVSLDHEAELLDRVDELVARREELWSGLVDAGLPIPRSSGNFLWLPTKNTGQTALFLEERGIIVRALGEGVRISVGEPESVGKLLSAAPELVLMLR